MGSEVESLVNREYKYGFVTDIESDVVPRGLSEDTVRLISEKKGEPAFMLEWRLKAYRRWLEMKEPHHWANIALSADRLPERDLLLRPADQEAAGKPGRGGPRAAAHLRKARHLADGAEDAGRGRG